MSSPFVRVHPPANFCGSLPSSSWGATPVSLPLRRAFARTPPLVVVRPLFALPLQLGFSSSPSVLRIALLPLPLWRAFTRPPLLWAGVHPLSTLPCGARPPAEKKREKTTTRKRKHICKKKDKKTKIQTKKEKPKT